MAGLLIEQHLMVYAGEALIELWPVIRNTGAAPQPIERVDTVALSLAAPQAELLAYTATWGAEFEPQRHTLDQPVVLEARSGRSSHGHHPWFALFAQGQQVLTGAVAWSGNWVMRFEPLPGGCALTGGLHDWEFGKTLAPGDTLTGAPVVLALGDNLNHAAQAFARVGRAHWYPAGTVADRLPTEWNHWWPYEDVDINEAAFAANVSAAADLGLEAGTLDAGWFGPAEAEAPWWHSIISTST